MRNSSVTVCTVLFSLGLAACADQPTGPRVHVMPGAGKSFEAFAQDQAICKQYAGDQVRGQAHDANERALIETVIGPVLKGRPYNYKIALQHDTQTSRGGDSSKATSQELVAWRHSTSRGNYYNLNLVEQFVDIINASSFVLFVLSKSLFTELEYRLCIETPKHKRLVLLADDIHDSIADSLLAPAQIFRGNFNFDFEQCRKGNRFGFNAEAEKSLLEADPLTMKSSRLLKLSNSLSNHSLNRNKISQNVRNQRLFN